jgi:hypothetical protein
MVSGPVDQAHFFAVLERQGPIAVVFDFVEPIAFWQLIDRECLHRFNEREASYSGFFH